LLALDLSLVSQGPIPLTTLIDSEGYSQPNEELIQAKLRAKRLSEAVEKLTGERNPLTHKSRSI